MNQETSVSANICALARSQVAIACRIRPEACMRKELTCANAVHEVDGRLIAKRKQRATHADKQTNGHARRQAGRQTGGQAGR